MARTPLTDAEIEVALAGLPGWTRDGAAIVREYRCPDFRAAVALVNRIADTAEAANHHPDLCVRRYRHLEVRLTTHDAGGVTARDVELATAIEHLAAGPYEDDAPAGAG